VQHNKQCEIKDSSQWQMLWSWAVSSQLSAVSCQQSHQYAGHSAKDVWSFYEMKKWGEFEAIRAHHLSVPLHAPQIPQTLAW